MSTIDTSTSVRTSIVIEAPVERAFDAFVHEMSSWWNPDHHILEGQLAEMVVEPRVGGHIYDRGVDGSMCPWARVLVYEPPRRVVFTWDIGPTWQLEPDPSKTSEVEVRFTAESGERTRVDLEHRHLDRHGPGWQSVADAVDGDAGWALYLGRYVGLFAAGVRR